MTPLNVHATALLLDGQGLLIRGRSGAGKSTLCLSILRRAESAGRAARLIADDRVDIVRNADGLVLSAPETLRGWIEIAGVGIVAEPAEPSGPLALVIDLERENAIARMPEDKDRHVTILGESARRIRLPERQSGYTADLVLTFVGRVR